MIGGSGNNKNQSQEGYGEGLANCAQKAIDTAEATKQQFDKVANVQNSCGLWVKAEKKDFSKQKEALGKATDVLIGLHRELTHGNKEEETQSLGFGTTTSSSSVIGAS